MERATVYILDLPMDAIARYLTCAFRAVAAASIFHVPEEVVLAESRVVRHFFESSTCTVIFTDFFTGLSCPKSVTIGSVTLGVCRTVRDNEDVVASAGYKSVLAKTKSMARKIFDRFFTGHRPLQDQCSGFS